MNKVVLITGGAGYIGSNIIAKLAPKGSKIICLDNFSNSYDGSIKRLMKKYNNVSLEVGDMLDNEFMERLFQKYNFDCVIHMAGKKYVKDSFYETESYYQNNIIATQNLLGLMDKYGIKEVIFSSSIAVYGNAIPPFKESFSYNPQSPYAEMKAEGEKMINEWCSKGKKAVVLRLSNPVGANVNIMLGDDSKNKSLPLLPYLLKNIDNKLKFNAASQPTKDGTTIRDYIHVEDVALAFVKAFEVEKLGYNVYNIGSGEPGYSVLDLVKQVEKETNRTISYAIQEPREGDVSISIGDNTKAKEILGFKVDRTIEDMVHSQRVFSEYLQE